MKLNSVYRELNRLHVGKKVSFIRASLCACAANFWNLIRKAFNNCSGVWNDMLSKLNVSWAVNVWNNQQVRWRAIGKQYQRKVKCKQWQVEEIVNRNHIMLTCPCNVCPLISHFYIVKLGFTGVYVFIAPLWKSGAILDLPWVSFC